jgi:hypothetical protein
VSLDILDGDGAEAVAGAGCAVRDETGDTRRAATSTSRESPLNRSMKSSFPEERDRDEYRSGRGAVQDARRRKKLPEAIRAGAPGDMRLQD